jgi:hypothetical protein
MDVGGTDCRCIWYFDLGAVFSGSAGTTAASAACGIEHMTGAENSIAKMNTSEKTTTQGSTLKVKFQFKALALTLSVVSLSWFFEALRQLKTGVNFQHVALLIVAVAATLFLLWIQAFWIYLEEKSKGTLKKEVALFDRLENWLRARANTAPSKKEREDLSTRDEA